MNTRSCGAGESEFLIRNNGDVYHCPIFSDEEYKIGNILDQDIDNISSINFFSKNRIISKNKYDISFEKCSNYIVEPF